MNLRTKFYICFCEFTLPYDTITMMSSVKEKTERKITIDNSFRYVSKDDHSHSEQTPPFSKERNKNTSKKTFAKK